MMSRMTSVGLTSVALLLSAVLAPSADAKAVKAKGNVQQGSNHCGETLGGLPVIGTVSFKRVGNVVSVKAKLTKGEPNATYGVQLAENAPEFCVQLSGELSFTTNSKGKGHVSGSFEVPSEATEFFADVDIGGFFAGGSDEGDTPTVSLP
jgi:small ligand-binding sensory domain FIST